MIRREVEVAPDMMSNRVFVTLMAGMFIALLVTVGGGMYRRGLADGSADRERIRHAPTLTVAPSINTITAESPLDLSVTVTGSINLGNYGASPLLTYSLPGGDTYTYWRAR